MKKFLLSLFLFMLLLTSCYNQKLTYYKTDKEKKADCSVIYWGNIEILSIDGDSHYSSGLEKPMALKSLALKPGNHQLELVYNYEKYLTWIIALSGSPRYFSKTETLHLKLEKGKTYLIYATDRNSIESNLERRTLNEWESIFNSNISFSYRFYRPPLSMRPSLASKIILNSLVIILATLVILE